MLAVSFVREHPDLVVDALRKRGVTLDLAPFRSLDERRRAALHEMESLKKLRNETSRKIGQTAKQGGDVEAAKEEMRRVGDRISLLEADVAAAETELDDFLKQVPNLPHASVPAGAGSEDNPVVRTWGEPPSFPFEAKSHWAVNVRWRVPPDNPPFAAADSPASSSSGLLKV